MKKILTILLVVLTASVTVFAQTRNITGVVSDQSGTPLIGATVAVNGTTTGTITDFEGNYTLSDVPDNATLNFSYIGFVTQDVAVSGQTTINVTMVEDITQLEEVVIIGYGTVKKKDLTGSVSVVDTKEAYAAPVATLESALQGRAAGIHVTSASGTPGSSPSIIIRGGNSITAGNDPLYVIDGFVGAGNLSSINPNDIESIQVLKDASSTAIYGARATNGVVLITTKKGKAGKLTVNMKASYGIQQLPQKVDNQTGYEYAAWVNSQAEDQSNLPFDLNNIPGEETDWQDVMIEPAPIQDYQFSASGGSDKTQYYMSAGILSQDGIVRGSSFDRYSIRTNINSQLSKMLKAGINVSLSRTNRDNNNVSFTNLVRQDPLMPVYKDDGTYNGQVYGVSNAQNNPLADNILNTNATIRDQSFINTYIQAELAEKITLKSTLGLDLSTTKQDRFIPSTNPTSIRNGLLAQARTDQRNSLGWLNENTINYNEKLGAHSFEVLGGITWQANESEYTRINANEIPSDGVGVNAVQLAPIENTSISSTYTKTSLFSLLGRANYNYGGKYYLTASIRRDGSSRLGENNKFAVFPSFALAWNVSEEPFLENVSTIDLLKVRASYGVTGNQGIPAYSTLSTLNIAGTAAISNGLGVAGVTQGNLANPNLMWETTTQYDMGFEIALLNRRLSAEVDLYYKKTEDLLLNAEVPFYTGYTTTIQNIGSLENKGVDVYLNGVLMSTNDLYWDASVNISTFKNKVTDLGIKTFIETKRLPAPANDANSRLIVGEPVGTFWGAVYDGINPETGDAIFADISGPDGVPDGVYDPLYDKTVIGNANPDFFGGVQTNVRYKNIDFQAFFPFSYGGQNYNEEMFLAGEVQINSFAKLRDEMWSVTKKENATVPGAHSTSFNTSNDFFLQDASFFRLGTLQLGYTLPSDLLKGINKFRVYFTGTNLFLIKSKDYLGYDPDVSSYASHAENEVRRGFDNVAYPQNRSFMVGLDISF